MRIEADSCQDDEKRREDVCLFPGNKSHRQAADKRETGWRHKAFTNASPGLSSHIRSLHPHPHFVRLLTTHELHALIEAGTNEEASAIAAKQT